MIRNILMNMQELSGRLGDVKALEEWFNAQIKRKKGRAYTLGRLFDCQSVFVNHEILGRIAEWIATNSFM